MEVVLLQPLQCPSSLLVELRLPIRHERLGEKPWFELYTVILARGGFLALPFLELLFDFCGLAVLLVEDGFGDAVPEAAALGGELLVFRRDDFRGGPEGVQIDEELRILYRMTSVPVFVQKIARSVKS